MNSPIKPTYLSCIRNCLVFILLCFFCACEDDSFDANSGTFTDKRDGHQYKWVKIGEQIWMAENLAYAPYLCPSDSQCGIWIYGYYGEGSYGVNYHTYGCLYDWETAKQVCPEGWHLPSDEEWMELERFLGMPEDELYDTDLFRGQKSNIGGKLKETGTTHWKKPNEGATNEVGFFVLPGGGKYNNNYMSINEAGVFWTSTFQSSRESIKRVYSTTQGGSGRY